MFFSKLLLFPIIYISRNLIYLNIHLHQLLFIYIGITITVLSNRNILFILFVYYLLQKYRSTMDNDDIVCWHDKCNQSISGLIYRPIYETWFSSAYTPLVKPRILILSLMKEKSLRLLMVYTKCVNYSELCYLKNIIDSLV